MLLGSGIAHKTIILNLLRIIYQNQLGVIRMEWKHCCSVNDDYDLWQGYSINEQNELTPSKIHCTERFLQNQLRTATKFFFA